LVLRYILIFNCLENLKIVKYISEFSRYGSKLFGLISSKYGNIFLDTILVVKMNFSNLSNYYLTFSIAASSAMGSAGLAVAPSFSFGSPTAEGTRDGIGVFFF